MSAGKSRSLRDLQQCLIRERLELSVDDRLRVVALIEKCVIQKVTRLPLLTLVKFEDNEVIIVPDMQDFIKKFEKYAYTSTLQLIDMDTFSVGMFDTGEDAYQQCTQLTDFLTASHQGWIVTSHEAVATYKKPRNVFRRIASTFESFDKKCTEYRVVFDLRKTAEIRKNAAIENERALLYAEKPSKPMTASSDTAADASSSVFELNLSTLLRSRQSAPSMSETMKKTPTPPLARDKFPTSRSTDDADASSSSDSASSVEIDSAAKEVSEEIKRAKAINRSDSSSSMHVKVRKAAAAAKLHKRKTQHWDSPLINAVIPEEKQTKHLKNKTTGHSGTQ